jgi:broad specificity phosphatase PhoE
VTRPILLALVRHGESEWIAERRFQGRADTPLTDEGVRQANAVGVRLAAPAAPPSIPVPDTAPLGIWHSPLRRAAQTAQAIHEAREADAPLRRLEALTELSQGEWEGLTHTEVRERYPMQLAAWRDDPAHHHAPGGESLGAARDRARQALESILEGAADDEIGGRPDAPAEPVLGYEDVYGRARRQRWAIVVGHDGLLRLMLLELLGVPMEHFWSFPFALASVSVVDLGGDTARLRAHNLDEHVTALDRPR